MDQPRADVAPRPLLERPTPGDAPASLGTLRCQWCSTTLPAGITTCPTCASPGIPDPRLSVPAADPAPVTPSAVETKPAGELVEWWRDGEDAADGEAQRSRALMSEEEASRRRVQSLIVMGGAAFACVVIGWLLAPSLLTEPMENFTGTPVDDPGSLRGLGAFFGLLVGLLVGATSGWVIWASK